MKLNLKYYPQHKDYSCGPVCLKMVFEHLGRKYSEEKLIALCKTSEKNGTTHSHLLDEIKREGFEYLVKSRGAIKDIIHFVESGYLIIVNYIEPLSKESHYAVVSGYDEKEKVIILADPCDGNDFTLGWGEFKKMWHNKNNSSKGWFLVVGREFIVE